MQIRIQRIRHAGIVMLCFCLHCNADMIWDMLFSSPLCRECCGFRCLLTNNVRGVHGLLQENHGDDDAGWEKKISLVGFLKSEIRREASQTTLVNNWSTDCLNTQTAWQQKDQHNQIRRPHAVPRFCELIDQDGNQKLQQRKSKAKPGLSLLKALWMSPEWRLTQHSAVTAADSDAGVTHRRAVEQAGMQMDGHTGRHAARVRTTNTDDTEATRSAGDSSRGGGSGLLNT